MNIAEILKDAPEGIKLYSPLFGEVELKSVSDIFLLKMDMHSNILNALQ